MEGKSSQAEIDLKLFRTWMKTTKALTDNAKKDIASHGLTIENFMVLELLYNKGPHYIQEISDKLMVPSGSITYVVNKLEKKELVKRELDEVNKRYCRVLLTENGQAMFDEIFPKHLEMIMENLASLDNRQKEQLTELLKIVGLAAKELS